MLGGKVRLAASLPGRGELAAFADWRAGECARRGVEIELGVDATAEAVLALAPDAVIVATGGRATTQGLAKWWSMPVPGSEQPFVIDHERALREAAALGPRVVIFDVVGHIEGPGLAELLASRGLEVTLASPFAQPMLLDAETLAHALGARLPRRRALVSDDRHRRDRRARSDARPAALGKDRAAGATSRRS